MTSIDLYDELIKNLDSNLLASDRESGMSQNNIKSDEFEILMKQGRDLLQQVKQINGDILRLKNRLVGTTKADKQTQICNMIKKLCDASYQKISQLRGKMQDAGKMLDLLNKENQGDPETISKSYRKRHLTEEVNRVLNDTFAIQKMVEKFSVDTNLKRIRLILPDAGEDQLKKLATNANGLQQAIASRVGTVPKKWVYVYNDIMSKTEGIKQLQASIEQNLRLMKEVASLVHQQGEMIDNILKNVVEAKTYVVKAEIVLVAEKQKHKKNRKKICCIIFIALAILALILTPIIIKVVKKDNSSSSSSTSTNSTASA